MAHEPTATGHAERLSALDASFLAVETETAPMTVGAVMVFGGGPLIGADGGVDFATIEAYAATVFDRAPRYRQRLHRIPVLGHAVWVDDDAFDLGYHLRHTSLPRPGDERQLKRLAGRIFSQRLDPARPLWEMWIVEGLGARRFAVIAKVHHCLLDGVAGADFMTELLRGTPDPTVPAPPRFVPRPAPSGAELLRRELAHRARATVDEARALGGAVRGGADLAGRAWAMAATLVTGLRAAADVPLNAPAGSPHRRVDWMQLPLDELKAVKNRHGGTVNDVVIAAISGALGRYLARLGAAGARDDRFRALLPVNVRAAGERQRLGNRVALLLARLPVDERDARRRFARVREETAYLKERSRMADSTELLITVGDTLSPALVNELVRLTVARRTFNVVISNIPGPPFPLYLLGSRLEALYAVPPLYPNQRLAFAVFSTAGQVYWTLYADRDAPGPHQLLDDVRAAHDELAALP